MFDRLRKELHESAHSVDVFFRDDDADTDLPQLRLLLAAFACREVPVSLAVIPGTLTKEAATLLRSAQMDQPLELHQHGWMHENHEQEGRKSEFGVSRTLEQQRQDIRSGRDRLKHMLHGAVSPVFTPPWNRCTDSTREALFELGFRVLSKDRGPAPARPLLGEVSICLDIFRWKSGPRLKPMNEIETEAIEALGRREPLGVLLHHKVMDGAAFDLTAGLIDALRSGGQARFHTVEGLCENVN